MSVFNKAARMSSRERIAICVLITLGIAGANIYLAGRTFKKTRNLTELYNRIIFSGSSFFNPQSRPENIFDRRLETAWVETEKASADSGAPRDPVAAPGTLYIQMETSFSHFPGDPPSPNPLKRIFIWSGNQASPETFLDYSRPRKIRIVFFYQKLVDIDRDFRLPGLPEFRADRIVVLADSPLAQEIPLDFMPPIESSRRFPENISQVWIRLEIQDLYYGRKYPDRVAISEIDFSEEFPTHDVFAYSR